MQQLQVVRRCGFDWENMGFTEVRTLRFRCKAPGKVRFDDRSGFR